MAKNCKELIWTCIQTAARHMHEIEHISISGVCLDLGSLVQSLDMPTLRKLNLAGVSDANQGSTELQLKVFPLTSLLHCYNEK
jgi:hypothetical protein